MIRGRRRLEGGRDRTERTCDTCGEPVRKDKRHRKGWAHARTSASTVDHDADSRGAVYRCLTCNQPAIKVNGYWVHQNPISDGHEAKQ